MTTTFFKESDYQLKFDDAINTLIDDWDFRYPGIETVEHVYFYFYATRAVDDNTTSVFEASVPIGGRVLVVFQFNIT